MTDLLLSVHLISAAVMASSLLGSAGVLLTNQAAWYKRMAVAVAGLTTLAVTSGIVLSVATSAGWLETCAKAGIYVALAAITEYALLRRLSDRPALLES